MTDTKTNALDAPASDAGDAEMTDEQLFDSFADAPGADGGQDEPDDEPEDDSGEDDGDDEADEGASDDDADDDGDDGEAKSDDPEVLRAQIERLNHQLKSERGRTSGQGRKIVELQREIDRAKKATRPGQVDDAAQKARKERLAKMQEDYPDLAGPLIEEIEDLRQREESLSAREADKLKDLEGQRDAALEREEKAFLEEHSDGFDVIKANAQAFRSWIDDQPKALRDAFAANREAITDATSAALLVSRFKETLLPAGETPPQTGADGANPKSTDSRRQRQLAGARTSRSPNRQSMTTDEPPEGASEEEIWAYWDRKDRAAKR